MRQCVLRGGLPFSVEMPQFNQKTLDAMEEAKRISQNPNIEGYKTMDELRKALED